jgi:uncharacterized Tic20 family protein
MGSPPPIRWAAVAAHASAAVAVIAVIAAAGRPVIWAGTVAFAGPLLVLAVARRDPFAARHARAAVRFNVAVAVYLVVIAVGLRVTAGSPYTIQFVPFLFLLNLLLAFNWLVFTAIAVQRAATGQLWTYPMTPGRRH